MKAFRNVGGNILEIKIDLDLNGEPILPPDTVLDPAPEALEGHYVTIVDRAWVQIPITVYVPTLQALKDEACTRLAAWKDWALEQPVEFKGFLFDADDTARNRLTQTLTLHSIGEAVPPAWVTKDNKLFPVTSVETLKELTKLIHAQFKAKFFQATSIRDSILACTTKEELEAVVIPVPNEMGNIQAPVETPTEVPTETPTEEVVAP